MYLFNGITKSLLYETLLRYEQTVELVAYDHPHSTVIIANLGSSIPVKPKKKFLKKSQTTHQFDWFSVADDSFPN